MMKRNKKLIFSLLLNKTFKQGGNRNTLKVNLLARSFDKMNSLVSYNLHPIFNNQSLPKDYPIQLYHKPPLESGGFFIMGEN